MKHESQVESRNSCINELQQQAYAQRLESQDVHFGHIESRREQSRLQEELLVCEGKSSSRYSNTEFSRDGRNEVSSRITSQRILCTEMKRKSWDSTKEFQEVESNHSGRLSYVPSQPEMIPSSRALLSRDKRLPLDTWNTLETQENVLGNQFSTFDSSQNHHQGDYLFTTPGETGPVPQAILFRKRWRANQGHNSNVDGCKKAVDHEFIIFCGYPAEFYGWTAKTADIGTARQDSKTKWLLVLIFHQKVCYGSKKWRWSSHWMN